MLFLFTVLSASFAQAQTLEVKTHTLKNGMKVLVNEDHSIPSVALYIFYRIGSRNEKPGITGLSHYFEHMMFNGAKKYGPGQFDIVMEAAGGRNNAYTTQNVTVYTDFFPPSALEQIFDLEADRIESLAFDPKIIESERGVVASERRLRVDNDNLGLVDEYLWATAFVAHPYQWPVIGWMSDIESWKMEDLKKHFEMGYSPANATMVISGDVKFEEIVRLSQKYLEPIKSNAVPPPITTVEPDQQGERRTRIEKFAQVPVVTIGYHIPATNHPDYYPLSVLQNILFSGESSRVYKRLVNKDQLVISVFGSSDLAFDPTLFYITMQVKPDVAPEAAEKALYEELEKVAKGDIKEEELQKAKNSLLVTFYSYFKTIASKANAIGNAEVFFGDYKKLLSTPEDFNRVKLEDLQRVANKYFKPRNRTVVTLVPTPEEKEEKPQVTENRGAAE